MRDEEFKAILRRLPDWQHESARQRIVFAESAGWEQVQIYPLGDNAWPADEMDLIGLRPSDGCQSFLP